PLRLSGRPPPEWGSGGRWFESSRPDIVRPARNSSSGGAVFFFGGPRCRELCRKPTTFWLLLLPLDANPLLLSKRVRSRFMPKPFRDPVIPSFVRRAHVLLTKRVATRSRNTRGLHQRLHPALMVSPGQGLTAERA